MGKQLDLGSIMAAVPSGKPTGAVLYPDRPNVAVARKMPAQKPGKSIQTYSTPMNLIDAIKAKFGIKEFAWDLAADGGNTKAARYFTEDQDSLAQDWLRIKGDCWLNPPFARIAPWAAKCAGSIKSLTPRRVFFLIPAAPGSNWWRDFVHQKARVVFLNGRPSFDGKAGFPKDLALIVYGEKPGYEVFSWQTKKQRKPARTPTGASSRK
jgi:phage N-6-adenine-methyltransferase